MSQEYKTAPPLALSGIAQAQTLGFDDWRWWLSRLPAPVLRDVVFHPMYNADGDGRSFDFDLDPDDPMEDVV